MVLYFHFLRRYYRYFRDIVDLPTVLLVDKADRNEKASPRYLDEGQEQF